MTILSRVLMELREEKGLTQNELAKQLGISRGYYSLLESSGEREPSLEFLRKLAGILVGPVLSTPGQYEAAFRLGLGALNYDFTDPHAHLIGSVDEELDIQADARLEAVWIISEILGETLSRRLLQRTVTNLTRDNPVRYTYFVPHGSTQWAACLELLKSALADKERDSALLEDGRLLAIACPPMTCMTPIRILMLSSSERLAAITLGDPTTLPDEGTVAGSPTAARPPRRKRPLLYELEPGQVNKIVAELTGVISNLRVRPTWRSEFTTYTRLFPPEPVTNE